MKHALSLVSLLAVAAPYAAASVRAVSFIAPVPGAAPMAMAHAAGAGVAVPRLVPLMAAQAIPLLSNAHRPAGALPLLRAIGETAPAGNGLSSLLSRSDAGVTFDGLSTRLSAADADDREPVAARRPNSVMEETELLARQDAARVLERDYHNGVTGRQVLALVRQLNDRADARAAAYKEARKRYEDLPWYRRLRAQPPLYARPLATTSEFFRHYAEINHHTGRAFFVQTFRYMSARAALLDMERCGLVSLHDQGEGMWLDNARVGAALLVLSARGKAMLAEVQR